MYWQLQLTYEFPVTRRSPGDAPSPMAYPRPLGTTTRPWCTRRACLSLAATPGISTPTPTWPTGTTSGSTSLPRVSGPSATPPSQGENLWRGEKLYSDLNMDIFQNYCMLCYLGQLTGPQCLRVSSGYSLVTMVTPGSMTCGPSAWWAAPGRRVPGCGRRWCRWLTNNEKPSLSDIVKP